MSGVYSLARERIAAMDALASVIAGAKAVADAERKRRNQRENPEAQGLQVGIRRRRRTRARGNAGAFQALPREAPRKVTQKAPQVQRGTP